MNIQHTPENTRQAQAQVHGAGFQTPPPPVGMMMSTDQFRELIETCKSESAGAGAGAGAGAADADFPGVNSVAVKLPTFWTHDPDLWFMQTEAVFASRVPAVTRDATKFNHVVTALPSEALNQVKTIIRLAPGTPDRYQQLKSILNTIYGKTAEEKHVELIEFASRKDPIMDQNPSSILLYIQDLSGDSKEAFERQVLLNRLPKSVRTTLSTSSAANNAEFAKEADQVMRAYKLALKNSSPSSSSVAAVSVSPEDSVPEVAAVSRPGASGASGASGCLLYTSPSPRD